MDCTKVEKNDMVERYVAHELSEKKQREFEAHYFQCEQCANNVYMLQNIVHQAKEISFAKRQVTSPESVEEKSGLWRRLNERIDLYFQPLTRPLVIGFSAIVIVFIIGGIKYIALINQVHQLQQPKVNTVYVSLFPASALKSSGENLNLVTLSKYTEAVTLEFKIDDLNKYTQFAVKILDNKKRIIWQNDKLRAVGLYESFSVVASTKFFQQGDYLLIVSGVSHGIEEEIQRFPFHIVFD